MQNTLLFTLGQVFLFNILAAMILVGIFCFHAKIRFLFTIFGKFYMNQG